MEGKAVCTRASTHCLEQLNTQTYDPKSCMQSAQSMGIMLDKLQYELFAHRQWMPLQELKAAAIVPKAESRASNSRQKIICKIIEAAKHLLGNPQC